MAENALSAVVRGAGGEMLPADPTGRYTHRFRIKSESLDRNGQGRLYTVAFDTARGMFTCSCPGWITGGGRRHCKHLKAIAPALDRALKLEGPK